MSRYSTSNSSIENTIKQLLNDPMVKILINGSNITQIQFQTFLIDHIMHNNRDKWAELNKNARFRVDRESISRGSFNRTLNQATKNIIQSIYTVFLLGYVGIFDSPALQPFLEASDSIRSHLDRVREVTNEDVEGKRAMIILSEQLESTINDLVRKSRLRNP